MPELAGLSAATLAVLKIAAWLASDDIPLDLLPAPDSWRKRRRVGRELSRLLSVGPDETVSILPDLQLQLREQFGPEGRDEAVLAMRAYLGVHDTEVTARCFRLISHLTAWIGLTRPENDFLMVLDLLDMTTVVLLESEVGALALPLIERTVHSAELLLAADDPRLLTVRDHLASVHRQARAPYRAIRVREQAVEASAAVLDPDHERLWNAYANLGADYLDTGAFEKAAELVGRVVQRHQRVLGAAHPDTMQARFNFGAVQARWGRADEATAMWREVLADAERELGLDHAVTALTRQALANQIDVAPSTTGLTEPAEPIGRETISDWIWYATCLRTSGRPAVARATLLRIIERGAETLGRAHPDVVRSRQELALTLQASGDGAAAVSTLQAAMTDADQVLGRLHRRTVVTAFYLVAQLLEQGRIDEYEPLLQDRLTDFIEVLGFSDPIVRELAVRSAALRLGNPTWWRT
jgi:tetratricopeptide (TPR) repeat protein